MDSMVHEMFCAQFELEAEFPMYCNLRNTENDLFFSLLIGYPERQDDGRIISFLPFVFSAV